MIEQLKYQNDDLTLEEVNLSSLVHNFGTPCYVYSESHIKNNVKEYLCSVTKDDLICFAVKANSNLSIIKLIAELGCGFDVVSGGELERVIVAGGDPKKVVFSGVGKTDEEISYAIKHQIKSINIESKSELIRVAEIAKNIGVQQDIALRINPEASLDTHPYLETGALYNKFGIALNDIGWCLSYIKENNSLKLRGVAFHIGSGIKKFDDFDPALHKALEIFTTISDKNKLDFIDVGGGLSPYSNAESIGSFVAKIKEKIPENVSLVMEPGKSIVARAGFLLTKVTYLKKLEKKIAVTDAGMNDMIRVPLYEGKHPIYNLQQRPKSSESIMIVGPICESADYFKKDYEFEIHESDILAIGDVGAYGFSMSSNYNSRPRVSEVMVNGNDVKLIRLRENNKQNMALEIFDDH
jgi:diaminopimelate decarboxylase